MRVYFFCTLCAFLLPDLSLGAGIRRNDFRTTNEQMEYLQRFGYLDAVRGGLNGTLSNFELRGSDFNSAVRLFQRKSHIPETGVVDSETMRMMNKPRCGVPDFPTGGGSSASEFKTGGRKWLETNLSYRIKKFTSKMSQSEQARAIHQAFTMWGNAAPLKFRRSHTSGVNIDISFETGDHEDGNHFPPHTNVLAHAFYPPRGDIHFNDDKKWSLNPNTGYDLLQVALHEIGHSLGLDHSDEKDAIMYKAYKQGLSTVRLHSDDIAGIQQLYPRSAPNPPAGGGTFNCPHNSPCNQGNRDRGKYYFPHDNRSKFVQCDNWGQCFNMDCPGTLLWDPVANFCNWPYLVNRSN